MKAKSVFLLGLSAVALASCGVKGYSAKVEYKIFKDQLSKAVENSSLLDVEKPYSLVMETNSESSMEITHMKDGKNLSEEITKTKQSGTLKYDSDKSIAHVETVYESTEETAESFIEKQYNVEKTYQCDSKYFYDLDNKTKLFEKSQSSKSKELVYDVARNQIQSFVNSLANMTFEGDGVSHFIDDNVYTLEIVQNENTDGISKNGKTVYQVTFKDDRIEFASEGKTEIKQLNFKEVIVENSSFSLRKKNVSLDEEDVGKYLEKSDDDFLSSSPFIAVPFFF